MCDREALYYPYLSEHSLNEIVEDNASCHSNECIRQLHQRHGVQLVGYEASDEEKEQIKELIRQQVYVYKWSHTCIIMCVLCVH